MVSFSESRRNWTDLPIELLGLILDRSVLLPDFIRFGAVCKPWSLAFKQAYNRKICLHKALPMLLVPTDDDWKCLYSIWENKMYTIHIPFATKYCGLDYGWLAFVEKNDVPFTGTLSITLLNPFSGTTIHLPTTYDPVELHKNIAKKVILSCDPFLYPDDWIVVVIVSVLGVNENYAQLAFIRSGEDSWNIHPWEDESQMFDYFFYLADACFYQGKLYMVNRSNHLVVIDFSQNTENVSKIKIIFPICKSYYWWSYLVEFGEDLLLIYKIQEFVDLKTGGFKVWKLSGLGNSTAEWIEIDDLGKFSLFLGDNNDCVAIYDSTNVANFLPNCIYYTDRNLYIYNLATRLINKHNILEPSLKYLESSAIWISPTLGPTLLSQD